MESSALLQADKQAAGALRSVYTAHFLIHTRSHLEINSVVCTHAYGNKQLQVPLENTSTQDLTCKPQGPWHLQMDTTHVTD